LRIFVKNPNSITQHTSSNKLSACHRYYYYYYYY